MTASASRRLLARIWFVLFPAFVVLVFFLVSDRGCFDRPYITPSIGTRAAVVWPAAMVYVAAHCWMAAAYVLTVIGTDSLLPTLADARKLWGSDWRKIVGIAVVFAFGYSPAIIWVRLSRMTGCGG